MSTLKLYDKFLLTPPEHSPGKWGRARGVRGRAEAKAEEVVGSGVKPAPLPFLLQNTELKRCPLILEVLDITSLLKLSLSASLKVWKLFVNETLILSR